MQNDEIDPWVIILSSGGQGSLAMWQLSAGQQPAIALFTSSSKAQQYARLQGLVDCQVFQPPRLKLLGLLIEYFRQQVELAVLDPDESGARRIFKLRDCLKAARDQLVFTAEGDK